MTKKITRLTFITSVMWLLKIKNKCLVLDYVDENKKVSKKYKELWEGVKKEIETINGGKKIEYGKDF